MNKLKESAMVQVITLENGLLERDLVGRGLLEVVQSSPETIIKKGQCEIEWRP